MIKIRKKEYRRKKLKWLEGLNKINDKNRIQNQEYNDAMLEIRHKEFRLYKERSRMELELIRLRIMKEQIEYAVNNVKADEMDELKLKEWKKANEENKKQSKED